MENFRSLIEANKNANGGGLAFNITSCVIFRNEWKIRLV